MVEVAGDSPSDDHFISSVHLVEPEFAQLAIDITTFGKLLESLSNAFELLKT